MEASQSTIKFHGAATTLYLKDAVKGAYDTTKETVLDALTMYVGGIEDGCTGMSPDVANEVTESNEVDKAHIPHDSGSVKTNTEIAEETSEKETTSPNVLTPEGVHVIVV